MGDIDLSRLLALTCLAAYLWGRRRAGLSAPGLRAATSAALETIGLCVLFLAANLALVLLAILVRALDRPVRVGLLDRRRHVRRRLAPPGARLPLVAGARLTRQRQSSRTKSSSRS